MKNYVLFASLMLFGASAFAASPTGCANGKPPHCTPSGHHHNHNSNNNHNTNTNTNTNTNNSTSSSSAQGGTASVDYSYREVRQAPAVGQGSFAIQGCAVAGNVGGSNTNGAAFLGLGWTPDECYTFMLAQAYQSVGEQSAACQILNSTKAAQRARKQGVTLPSCEPSSTPAPETRSIVPAVDTSNFVTREDLNGYITREEAAERDSRVLKQVSAK